MRCLFLICFVGSIERVNKGRDWICSIPDSFCSLHLVDNRRSVTVTKRFIRKVVAIFRRRDLLWFERVLTVLAKGDSVDVEIEPHRDDITGGVRWANVVFPGALLSDKGSDREVQVATLLAETAVRYVRCGNDANSDTYVFADAELHLANAYSRKRHARIQCNEASIWR